MEVSMNTDSHSDSTATCSEFTLRVHSDGRHERLATVYSDDHACVEFAFRVHSDGRRECLATVLVRDQDGVYRPGPRRPTGELAKFVAKAIGEAKDELSPTRHSGRAAVVVPRWR
jgi:hypothetical protein